MSDLSPDVVWPSSAWRDGTRRWRSVAASAAFWLVVGAGAVFIGVAAFNGLPSYPSAHMDIWILAGLALASDLVPFRLPPPARRTTTFLLSPCFCFSIFLLYPPATGVVVQVLAIAFAAPRLHMRWPSLLFLTARLVWALTIAGWVANYLRRSDTQTEYVPSLTETRIAVPAALVCLGVSVAISLVGALLSSATHREMLAQLRMEVIARSSVLLIGVIIVSTPTLWSHALLAIPLIGWYHLSWMLGERERRIEHDPVSGLLSRQGLAAAVEAIRDVPGRDVDWYELTVVELRGIAKLHRRLGHTVTERLTVAAAERLRSGATAPDRIGQLSEGQLVLLRQAPLDKGGLDSAHGVVAALSEPIDHGGVPFRLEPVAGVAICPQHGRGFDELLANAEAARVEADLHQELALVYTPEDRSAIDDRWTLLCDLREALDDPARASEIVVLYQPQVSLATGRTESVEALLRWSHPSRGLIPTDDLIELVEPTGVMQQLTHYVLDRVVGQLAEWNRMGIQLRAAVNVSVNDLVAEHFDNALADTLRSHGVPARQLDIEITERALVEDTQRLDEAAHRVVALGVGLSLDDFGTGFASLRRLRQMPLAEVKIDRAYVSRIGHSPADREMVTTIHGLANVLGLRIVAEGIEDEETARVLTDLGGVIGQGWLYARPMTAPQLVGWLNHQPHAAG
ncbi:bifunctional diguanylate cyclase/phosphodiesterase [Asanoa sp. NPDC050611]|uniref:putative bifunctional diguanylate cyclase/phosphodiesterase n=1 Tax=Asanoa sp. NPDC050611 TaxID=3157098 RepID=UPI0033C4AC65